MTTVSKWATANAAPPAPPVSVEDTEVEDTAVTGPAAPTAGISPPDVVDQLPVQETPAVRNGGSHYYLSAHGGAGATTLAVLDSNGFDAGGAWPCHPDGNNVVVVARGTVQGLAAACAAARHWASGELPGVNLLALVIVPAYPGRASASVNRMKALAAGVFPRCYTTRWHPEFMDHKDTTEAPRSKHTAKTIRTINAISNRTPAKD